MSRHTPKACVCPKAPIRDGVRCDPMQPGERPPAWYFEWRREDCTCCEHLRTLEGWTRCSEVCVRLRFPSVLAAEWEFMRRVMKQQMVAIVSPMGGMTDVHYQLDERAVEFWATLAGIPKARWEALIDLVEQQHRDVERLAKQRGAFTLDDAEWATLCARPVADEEAVAMGWMTEPDAQRTE